MLSGLTGDAVPQREAHTIPRRHPCAPTRADSSLFSPGTRTHCSIRVVDPRSVVLHSKNIPWPYFPTGTHSLHVPPRKLPVYCATAWLLRAVAHVLVSSCPPAAPRWAPVPLVRALEGRGLSLQLRSVTVALEEGDADQLPREGAHFVSIKVLCPHVGQRVRPQVLLSARTRARTFGLCVTHQGSSRVRSEVPEP